MFILQNLIPRTRLCSTGFITQPSWFLDLHLTESVMWKWFVLAVCQFWKGISAGPALKYFTWLIGAGGGTSHRCKRIYQYDTLISKLGKELNGRRAGFQSLLLELSRKKDFSKWGARQADPGAAAHHSHSARVHTDFFILCGCSRRVGRIRGSVMGCRLARTRMTAGKTPTTATNLITYVSSTTSRFLLRPQKECKLC